MIQVTVKRDSVSMGDDIEAPHYYEFNVPCEGDLKDVFDHLAKKRYLVPVNGENHTWDAIIKGQSIASFKGNNRFPEPSEIIKNKLSNYF